MTARGTYFDAEESHGRSSHSTLILVEGPDDAYFVDKILSDLGASPDTVRVSVAKGRGNIPELLRVVTLSAGFRLGIISKIIVIADADQNETASIEQIHAAFRQVGLPIPQVGTFENNGSQEVGLIIIPGNGNLGELSDLLLAATSDARLTAVANCFDQILREYGPLPKPSRSKRVAHMYMQVRPEDCRGLGRAYALGAFTDNARINEIRDFLRHAI